MPADDGARLNHDKVPVPIADELTNEHPHEPFPRPQFGPPTRPCQDEQLMAKEKVLEDQLTLPTKGRTHQHQ